MILRRHASVQGVAHSKTTKTAVRNTMHPVRFAVEGGVCDLHCQKLDHCGFVVPVPGLGWSYQSVVCQSVCQSSLLQGDLCGSSSSFLSLREMVVIKVWFECDAQRVHFWWDARPNRRFKPMTSVYIRMVFNISKSCLLPSLTYRAHLHISVSGKV